MCIIIAIPNNKKVADWVLRNSWNNNPHGAGMMYVQNNKLKVFKTRVNVNELIKKYHEVKDNLPNSNIVIHFRWATHGDKSYENTHPFIIRTGLAFCHNGILKGYGNEKTKSDTVAFMEEVLCKLPKGFYLNEAIMTMMSDFIGHNKLCFLDRKNRMVIVNEKLGVWKFGCWFSNTSFEFFDDFEKYEVKSSRTNHKNFDRSWLKMINKAKASFTENEDDAPLYKYEDDQCGQCGAVLRDDYNRRVKMCDKCLENSNYIIGENGFYY